MSPGGTGHNTSLDALRTGAAALAPWGRRFADRGGWRLYVVGGAVRSLLAGRPLGDGDEVDMTTDAPPGEIMEILEGWADTVWTQGERFGTVGCRRGGRIVEITTHRAEVYTEGSRRPDVTYGDDLLVDLARRDFTIGAMAFELPAAPAAAADIELVDPFGGWDDLCRRRLRTPRSPEQSFSEDPLRILRAGRFVATLGLVADADLLAAMESLRGRLDIVSVERCGRELSLLLAAEAPAAGVAMLAHTGVLAQIVPELVSVAIPRPPATTLLDALPPEESLRLAGLLWPLDDVAATARRLRFPAAVARRSGAIATSARALLTAAGGDTASDADARRWAAAAGDVAAAAVDLAGIVAADSGTVAVADFVGRWRRLCRSEALDAPAKPLKGAEVMAHLGIAAGPAVGAALRHLEELRITRGPLSPAAARRHLTAWWEAEWRPSADA